MPEVDTWRDEVARSTPVPIPSVPSSIPSKSAPTEPSSAEYDAHVASLADVFNNEEILSVSYFYPAPYHADLYQGLQVPCTVDPVNATSLALAYAIDTHDIVRAEAFIAERRYRQMLISAKCYKIHLVKARQKCEQSSKNLDRFRGISSNITGTIHREDRHESTAQNGISTHSIFSGM